MKIALLAILAASIATPAIAQHEGHQMPMPKPTPKPPAKPSVKSIPRKEPAKPVTARKARAEPSASTPAPKAATASPSTIDPHAGHAMPPPADPHAGQAMPMKDGTDQEVGETPPALADPHAGHDMSMMEALTPPPAVAPPSSAALGGPAHAADAVYGAAEMAEARARETAEHGGTRTYKVMIDQLETQIRKGSDGYYWEALAWYGGDINKLWITTEGEGNFGDRPEKAEIQILYSRALNPWFNLQTGLRHDFRPDPERSHLVLGIEGLAPYWFEVTGAVFLSNQGEFTARFEGEYDQRLTRRLILQPRVEFNLAAQNVPEIGVGSGLVNVETSLRLRYEFIPEFAPYIGVGYERAFGNTADIVRGAGEDVGGWSLLLGVRAWF